jgi:uncharacterized membrane protein YedE/YeeE
MNFLYLGLGALFGFLLSRAGVTDYEVMLGLFRLQDFHVAGVMGVGIGVSALGLAWLTRTRSSAVNGCPLELAPKPGQPRLFLRSLVFGAGWGLTGA